MLFELGQGLREHGPGDEDAGFAHGGFSGTR
jgi:hypothetical protein